MLRKNINLGETTMKKGELSMSMIIMAVIAIIILVIVIFLKTITSGNVNDSKNCPSKGGVCTDYIKCGEQINSGSCGDTTKVCCNPRTITGNP